MTTTVADVSTEVAEMRKNWELVAALLGGTAAIRLHGTKYLPKWPQEEVLAWEARRDSATLFPGFKRTVTTLSGKPFSKPLTYGDDVPERIKKWCEDDVDMQGRDLHTFANDLEQLTVGYGLSGVLVDYPKGPPSPTQADEAAQGKRPYMVLVKPQMLLGWRYVVENGKFKLIMLRLIESVTVDDGEYGTKEVEQVRVLVPGAWATWRKVPAATPQGSATEQWVKHEDGTTSLNYIPFAPTYGERLGFMCSKPPLLELAHMNVEHWQSASDQRTILHIARVPILVASGVDDPKFEVIIGAASCVKLPTGGDLKYVEHTGAAIAAGAADIAALEERMRQAGAELLLPDSVKITAFQVASENAMSVCVLQAISLGVEDALDLALQFMADFVTEKTGGHVTLFNDYVSFNLAEASAVDLIKMNASGKLSDETLFKEMQRRALISSDITWEDEQGRIDSQGPPLSQPMPGLPGGGPGAPAGGGGGNPLPTGLNAVRGVALAA